MSDDCLSYRTTTLVGIDRKGATFLPLLRAAIDVVGATALLRAQGICDISRLSDAPCTTAARSGVPDLSTTQDEVRAAHAAPGGAHMPQKVAERVIAALVDRVVEISLPEALGERNVLWIQDMRTIATSVSGLRDLSRRLPHHTITVLGFPPAPDLRDEQFKHAYAHLITLREQGVIATTIVPDIRSPLVLRVGEEVQEVLLAQALAHGLVGHLHDDRNPSFAEQMVRLGARSPFVAAALGSTRVVSAAAQRERWYEAVRRILRRHANGHEGHGQGALVDARSQARDLTRLLLHDETLRTVGAPLDVDTPPLFLSYSVPIRLDDTRIRAFAGDLRPWLASTYPSSIASIVQGQVKRVQGRTNGKIGTAQMMYGACWYGIGPLAWARPELESLGVDGDDGDQRESRDETAPERERESAHKSGGQDGKESTGKGED